jgi:hypothetical protein
MKKVLVSVILVLAGAAVSYAQMCWAETAFNQEKNRMLEIARAGTIPNGCGSFGSPQRVVEYLTWLGDSGACDAHDRKYSTPGYSKSQADQEFYDDLLAAGVDSGVAWAFYQVVAKGGQSAYDSAQRNARHFQQLEADPSSRQYSIPSDDPYGWY